MCLSLQIAAREHLRQLALLRRARDRIDRETTVDIDALARDANLTPGDFVHRFALAYGQSPHAYQRTAKAVRNREAPAAALKVA
jgi:AraC-like DNA-binding protein